MSITRPRAAKINNDENKRPSQIDCLPPAKKMCV